MTMQNLLNYTVQNQASDLHLVPGSPPTIRLDGALIPVAGEKILTPALAEELISGILTGEQKQTFVSNREFDFAFSFADLARFRVNLYFQKSQMSASFRFIPKEILGINQLGLPQVCHKFATLKQGFILVTGPTGHGKSTTLAAILEEINQSRPVHVVTIEDPIEYVYVSKKAIMSQREVHSDTHSWSAALRAVLREDPDIVLIGEMRDFETISSALTIAETGHLVFATLHTNSAAQTIDRIVDVFPQSQQTQVRLQLSSNLEAVFSQRLVPKIGGGRAVAYELMTGTSAVRTTIREGREHTLDNIMITSAEYGMSTLEASLANLVKTKSVALETASQFALRPMELARHVRSGI